MDLLGQIIILIYIASAILILAMIFLERSDPRSIAFWILVLALLPIIGFIIYLIFGQTFYRRKEFSIKNLDDSKIAFLKSEAMDDVNRRRCCDENKEDYDFAVAMMSAGGSIYSSNNDVKLYTVGDPFFKDLFDDMRKAKEFIHAEFYILRNDALTNEFMDILIEKAQDGVEVRLMIDAIGNNKGPRKKVKELVRAGGEYAQFHSNILYLFSPKKNNRNHRKIIVIDGEVGYVSGFNIGDEYLGKGELGFWRDSAVRVVGHGILPMNIRFFMDWGYTSGKRLDVESDDLDKYFPLDLTKEYGNDLIQLISGGPDAKDNPIELQYMSIINVAKRTLYIHSPYLAPTDPLFKSLLMAANSGVDVKIIIPDKPDHPFVYWVSLWFAGELLEKGVRIYQYKKGFVHSKTMVADGRFCSVGSANLDNRSMVLNFESNAMICSTDIGKQMDDAFMEDLNNSKEDHKNLTKGENFKISISRLFSPLA